MYISKNIFFLFYLKVDSYFYFLQPYHFFFQKYRNQSWSWFVNCLWLVSVCLFRCSLLPKDFSQKLHLNFLTPSWTVCIWILTSLGLPRVFLHNLQGYLIPSWILWKCLFSEDNLPNAFPQESHMWSFFPSWTHSICLRKSFDSPKAFLQNLQTWCFCPSWTCKVKKYRYMTYISKYLQIFFS